MTQAVTGTDPRYPVGPFQFEGPNSPAERTKFIQQIEEAPARLRTAVKGLDDKQLDTPYREGGWTVRQVVHHVPDSHMNAFIRLKLALTEDNPTIKPYNEKEWAKLADAREPIENSLDLLESVHKRFVTLWKSLRPADFERMLSHPEAGPMSLDKLLALYAWHGRHHVGHITELRKRNRW
jgi:uncharacterized damage-inducible protein DinB